MLRHGTNFLIDLDAELRRADGADTANEYAAGIRHEREAAGL